MNNSLTATLFVGIDVSSKTNYVFAMDFFGKKLLSFEASNNLPGAQIILQSILDALSLNKLTHLTVAMESTSFYSWHIANFLSANKALVWFHPKVYCLNPRIIHAYKKTFVVLDKKDLPFSNTFGALSMATLTDFLSTKDIANTSIEDLVAFLVDKGKDRFSDPNATAKLLVKAARDSYRLDKALADPLNATIAASLNCIKALEEEVKTLDKAIEKAVKVLDTHEFECALSIKGIGPVFAAGIIAEIGDITKFDNQAAVAKYAGLTWRKKQSGSFTACETFLTKTGNKYLRYYLIEAANSVKNNNEDYYNYYAKKYSEALLHKHKRALALTARKLVRLIFALLRNNQLYTSRDGANRVKTS